MHPLVQYRNDTDIAVAQHSPSPPVAHRRAGDVRFHPSQAHSTMPAPLDLHGRSLLAVFAHPDDESIACGGLLAWCAHLGADVSLLCMTHGEHGQGAKDIRRMRSRELESAARALGIRAVTLLDHEDGMLPWLPADTLRSAIERGIRARRPEVLITFDADGLYWHPDHIAVHELTTAAVVALGDAAPALYYVTMPPGSMRAVVDHTAALLPGRRADETASSGETADPGHLGEATPLRPATAILGVADPDAFGSAAPEPTLVVDTGNFATRKLAALACHASQFTDSALAYLSEREAPRFLGIEHYRRATAGAAGRTFLEDLGSCPEPADRPHDGGGASAGGG